MTGWTERRLGRLFERYRRLYWPRSRRLRSYRVRVATVENAFGECVFAERILQINVAAHRSDRAVRDTVLHEMVHAAVGRPGHHSPFWAELEYLLTRRAPVSVGFPELGEQSAHLAVIPLRFRRCRRMFRRVYLRQQNQLKRLGPAQSLTPADLDRESCDFAEQGATWKGIWQHQAHLYGFENLDGRALAWARPYQRASRRGYRRGRQFFLEMKRRRHRTERLTDGDALFTPGQKVTEGGVRWSQLQ